jgi:hypothetical protein
MFGFRFKQDLMLSSLLSPPPPPEAHRPSTKRGAVLVFNFDLQTRKLALQFKFWPLNQRDATHLRA